LSDEKKYSVLAILMVGVGKADLAIFDQATGSWFVRTVDGSELARRTANLEIEERYEV